MEVQVTHTRASKNCKQPGFENKRMDVAHTMSRRSSVLNRRVKEGICDLETPPDSKRTEKLMTTIDNRLNNKNDHSR